MQKCPGAHAPSLYVDILTLHPFGAARAGRRGQNASGSNLWPLGLLAARLNSVAL